MHAWFWKSRTSEKTRAGQTFEDEPSQGVQSRSPKREQLKRQKETKRAELGHRPAGGGRWLKTREESGASVGRRTEPEPGAAVQRRLRNWTWWGRQRQVGASLIYVVRP